RGGAAEGIELGAIVRVDEQPRRDGHVEVLLRADDPGVSDDVLDAQALLGLAGAREGDHLPRDVDSGDRRRAPLLELAGEEALPAREVDHLLVAEVADEPEERVLLDEVAPRMLLRLAVLPGDPVV